MIIGITDRIKEAGSIEKVFESKGVEFRFLNSLNERDFKQDEISKVDALLVWHAKITEYTSDRLDNCKVVVRYGVGFDQVDGAALKARGIPLANNPSYCTEEVADTSVAMILAMTRNIVGHDTRSRSYYKTWQENSLLSKRSSQCKVGLIGAGRIGSATAIRLKALGFQVSIYDPYANAGLEKVLGVSRATNLEVLLSESNIISLHCPLTSETDGMINSKFLSLMQPDGILINTARGKILASLDDLYSHLINNPQFRVALDVLPQEPAAVHPLIDAWRRRDSWLNERLIINPHNAYHSDAAYNDMRYDALLTAYQAVEEKRFRNIVNDVG